MVSQSGYGWALDMRLRLHSGVEGCKALVGKVGSGGDVCTFLLWGIYTPYHWGVASMRHVEEVVGEGVRGM